MTRLTRPVKRETNAVVRDRGRMRPLMVKLEEGGHLMRLWPKGTRQVYTVPFEAVYRLGVQIRVEEMRAEKAAKRKERVRGNRR